MLSSSCIRSFLIALTLGLSALSHNASADSEACGAHDLNILRAQIAEHITTNPDVVTHLLDEVIAGHYSCTIEQTMINGDGVSLNTCGYVYPHANYNLVINGQHQAWSMTIREDRIDCGGRVFALTDLRARNGDIIRYVAQNDQVLAQVTGGSCATPSEYQVVRFNYQDQRNTDRQVNVTKLLNTTDQAVCENAPSSPTVTLSIPTLGLTPADLDVLK